MTCFGFYGRRGALSLGLTFLLEGFALAGPGSRSCSSSMGQPGISTVTQVQGTQMGMLRALIKNLKI